MLYITLGLIIVLLGMTGAYILSSPVARKRLMPFLIALSALFLVSLIMAIAMPRKAPQETKPEEIETTKRETTRTEAIKIGTRKICIQLMGTPNAPDPHDRERPLPDRSFMVKWEGIAQPYKYTSDNSGSMRVEIPAEHEGVTVRYMVNYDDYTEQPWKTLDYSRIENDTLKLYILPYHPE